MSTAVSISVKWLGVGDGPWTDPTAARIGIHIGGRTASLAEDLWSRSVVGAVPLSAKPLALWLAASWWRLRWEAVPSRSGRNTAWRLAHELAAAGEGFVGPHLTFLADGETVTLEARPSSPTSREMLRHLANFDAPVCAEAFEQAVDAFIELVLARCAVFGADADLRSLWEEVHRERVDSELSRYRRLEAMAGFDAGEGPEYLPKRIADLSQQAGEEAVPEIAAICASYSLSDVLSIAAAPGLPASLPQASLQTDWAARPHDRGYGLARSARRAFGLDAGEPMSNAQLGDCLGLRPDDVAGDGLARNAQPMALAVRNAPSHDRIVFRKPGGAGRRFEAARMLGDHLLLPDEAWHPSADTDTARQKTQRAFAAEFLAPLQSIRWCLDGDFSEDSIDVASEHFEVSSKLIVAQLVNQGVLPRSHPAASFMLAR